MYCGRSCVEGGDILTVFIGEVTRTAVQKPTIGNSIKNYNQHEYYEYEIKRLVYWRTTRYEWLGLGGTVEKILRLLFGLFSEKTRNHTNAFKITSERGTILT